MEEHNSNQTMSNKTKRIVVLLSSLILAVGACAGPLLLRLYFLRGGKRIWFSSFLQTAGFPIIFIPLIVLYRHRRRQVITETENSSKKTKTRVFVITPFLALCSAAIGVLVGVDDYMYSYGMSKLPVSTSSLIISTQLAFVAVFAYLFVKQKFTAFSTNAVVLLTLGAVVLGIDSGSDRPHGESNQAYILGFVLTVIAAGLYGLMLPLIELSYLKAKQTATSFTLVLEYQLIMGLSATIFTTVGMIVNKDFEVIPREASKEFDVGEVKYYVIAVVSGVIWQFFFVGAIGVICYGSSLLSGVIITVLLPVSEIFAVIFYHEKFQAEKGIALFLSLWGFVSYAYGEIKQNKKQPQNDQQPETQMTTSSSATADDATAAV